MHEDPWHWHHTGLREGEILDLGGRVYIFCRFLHISLYFDTLYPLKDPNLRYGVAVDRHFLTKPVPELFQKHELLTVPFITGINNHEGGFLLASVSFQFPNGILGHWSWIAFLMMPIVHFFFFSVALCSSRLDWRNGSRAGCKHGVHFLPSCKTHVV